MVNSSLQHIALIYGWTLLLYAGTGSQDKMTFQI